MVVANLEVRSLGGVDSMPNNNPQQTTPQQQIAKAAEGANRAAERLEHSAEQVTSAAIEKVRQVREEAQSGIEHQREEIANRVRRVGGVLRSTGQTLGTDDPLSQQLFDAAGDRIERIAEYISSVTPGSLAGDVQSLARRQPGLFFGGSFILGLALGRFAKSSAAGAASERAFAGDADTSYEDTSAVRSGASARRRQPGRDRAASGAQQSPRNTGGLPEGVSGSSSSGSSSSGSNVSGTTGSGSAHTAPANAAPSYGAASGTVARPAASSGTASGKPHDVGPGEGSKL
jgi:hypothetical protein